VELMLVDMETLVQPRVTPVGDDGGHMDSVLQTGLLPQWECQQDTRHSIDVSGLRIGAVPSILQRRWRFINTDAMHVAWNIEPMPLRIGVKGPDGRAAPLDGFEDDFVSGFEQMYRFIVRYRRGLLAHNGPLEAFRGQESRLIFRATQTYARISEQSLAPQYLRSGIDWSIEVEHLCVAFLDTERKPVAWPLLCAERRAKESLDVPYFASITSETRLLGLDSPLQGYLRCSGYDAVVARVRQFGKSDFLLQRAIIRGALRAHATEPHATASLPPETTLSSRGIRPALQSSDPQKSKPPLAETFMAEAATIGRMLSARVICLSAERINWLGLTRIRNNERIQVSLLSPNLYDGVCGVAVFLAALSFATGNAAWGNLALRALEPVRHAIGARKGEGAGRMIEQLGLGGTLGIGSVVYALCKVGGFVRDASLLEDALVLARAIAPKHVRSDVRFDIMAGSAGAILGLLVLHGLTHERFLLRRAAACALHLTSAQNDRGEYAGSWQPDRDHGSRTGFAHGASGVAMALLRLYAHTGQEELRRAALRAFAFERKHQRANNGKKERANVVRGWCRGPPGTGLASLGALEVVDSPALRRDAMLALTLTRSEGATGVDHLCCGNLGRTETLLVGAAVLGEQHFQTTARAQAAAVVARARTRRGYRLGNTPSSGATLDNPALFQGLSGIGYQLIRLARPELVPSLLLFQ
jgi:type 2 lantibiotic biosynthesis protein LanM